jgi:hypothetical protein
MRPSDHRGIWSAGSSQSSASKLGPEEKEVAGIAHDRPRRLVLTGGHGVGDGAAEVVNLGDVAAKGVTGFATDAVGAHPPGQVTDPGEVPVADLAERAAFHEALFSELAQGLQLPVAGTQVRRRRHHHRAGDEAVDDLENVVLVAAVDGDRAVSP